jgi:hypothetical protein
VEKKKKVRSWEGEKVGEFGRREGQKVRSWEDEKVGRETKA